MQNQLMYQVHQMIFYACSGTSKYDTSFATCGDRWKVDAMRTVNLTVGYMFDNGLRGKRNN